MCSAISAEAFNAVEALMDATIEQELEEIKALMEEMDLDSVEVRLEVEVELSSDSECCDADEDGEDDSGDELVSSGSESSDGCEEARFARGVQALSSNSCSDASDSSSGDDEDGMEKTSLKRRRGVTFKEEVEVVYIEACNIGRKVAELMTPSPSKMRSKSKSKKTAPAANTKTYKLRSKDGPVFVELTEEAAAYLKFIQVSREHGHDIQVTDFFAEAQDFAKGILPPSYSHLQTPSKSPSPTPEERATPDSAAQAPRTSAKPGMVQPTSGAQHAKTNNNNNNNRTAGRHRTSKEATATAAPLGSNTTTPDNGNTSYAPSTHVHNGAHYFYHDTVQHDYTGSYSFADAPLHKASLYAQQYDGFASAAQQYMLAPTYMDGTYQNGHGNAHRPMRGRGRGQQSRHTAQSNQPYKKQQARTSARK